MVRDFVKSLIEIQADYSNNVILKAHCPLKRIAFGLKTRTSLYRNSVLSVQQVRFIHISTNCYLLSVLLFIYQYRHQAHKLGDLS